MRTGCLINFLAIFLLLATVIDYIFIELPREVVFQQVPVDLAASRRFSGTIGDPCGAVTVELSDEAASAIRQRGLAAFKIPRFKVQPRSWSETPSVPRYRTQWDPWCLPVKQTDPVLIEIDALLVRTGSYVWENDEGIVVVDPAHRRILNAFFYK